MKFIHIILIFCILLYLFTLNKITVEGFDNNIKFRLIFDSYINKLNNDEFQNIINKSFNFIEDENLQQKYLKYKQKYLNLHINYETIFS